MLTAAWLASKAFLAGIPAVVWKWLIVGAAVLLLVWGAYSWAYNRGAASRDDEVAALRIDRDAARANVLAAAQANAEWQTTATNLQTSLKTCQDQWADLNTRSTAALVAADAGRKKAEAQLATFTTRWDARNQTCGTALLNMQAACEGQIGDY